MLNAAYLGVRCEKGEMNSDWRLQGQEAYLKGVTLTLQRWSSSNPQWDHDHCEFCGAKFMAEGNPEALSVGYATGDRYRWVCPPCFEDFNEQFEWHVAES